MGIPVDEGVGATVVHGVGLVGFGGGVGWRLGGVRRYHGAREKEEEEGEARAEQFHDGRVVGAGLLAAENRGVGTMGRGANARRD